MRRCFTVVAVACAVATPAFADITTPAGAGNAQGPAPIRYYGTGGSETQQIYSSTFFSSPALISAISFRAYPGAAPSGFSSNSVTISNAMVRLATTGISANEASGLQPSTNFAANLGAAFTTVYSGSLTLTTAATGSGPQPFDYTINFMTPFVYDPTAGNLLLDVLIPSTATVSGTGFGFLTFDNVNTLNDGVRSIVNVNAAAGTGTLDTSAAITRFQTSAVAGAVPEPATWAMLLVGFGMAGASLRRRKISTVVTFARR